MKVLEAFGEPIADGGQESFVFSVIEKMDLTDLEIDCITAYDCRSNRYRKLIKEKGGNVYSLKLPFTPGKSRANIKAPFARFLKQHQYDVIHIHSGSISVLAIMAAVANKAGVKKVIVHSHCTGDKDNIKHKTLRFLASLSMRRHVDIYCACSKMAADWKFIKRYAAKTVIIKNGIDLEKYAYNDEKRKIWRTKLGFNGETVIGHVGRFCYQKNQEFLVVLLDNLLKKNSNYRLLLVGDGEDKQAIEHLAERKNLRDKIVFAGSVDNVEDYLQAMDVFAFPSRFEGLGIVAIEAQANGLPVIASDEIPKEVKVLNDVRFAGIENGADEWLDIIEKSVFVRKDNTEQLIKAGFDSTRTATLVRNLYISDCTEDMH